MCVSESSVCVMTDTYHDVHLSEELLHEGLCPAVVQFPALSGMTDISRVQHQGQHFSLVYSDRHIHQSVISHIQTRAVKSITNDESINYTPTFTNKGHEMTPSSSVCHSVSLFNICNCSNNYI